MIVYRNKMNRTSIVACARWESDHIQEWVMYHLFLGFDHIYLYCNDDDPRDMYKEVAIFCREANPKVTFLHYPFQGEQWKMYIHFLENFKGNSENLCFLDVDEFITTKKHHNINDYIHDMNKADWDVIFFNWVNFGNNGLKERQAGNVLDLYTKRSENISHLTKVIVRSDSINVDFMKKNPCPFWHGLSSNTYNVFNYNLKNVTSFGSDFSTFYESWWGLHHADESSPEIRELEAKVFNTAYVSHFFMKSEADAERRIQRGTSGNFSNQSDWSSRTGSKGGIGAFLEKFNAVEDFTLRDRWKGFFVPRPEEYFIRPSSDLLISEACHCTQSSTSDWSRGGDAEHDASNVVDLPANGQHKNHTDHEEQPWWQIDLGQQEPVSEIRFYHRLEREHELKNYTISYSRNGADWHRIVQGKNAPFGGIDGRPLILDGLKANCRYVRFQLDEPGYIHFDRVEVYRPH